MITRYLGLLLAFSVSFLSILGLVAAVPMSTLVVPGLTNSMVALVRTNMLQVSTQRYVARPIGCCNWLSHRISTCTAGSSAQQRKLSQNWNGQPYQSFAQLRSPPPTKLNATLNASDILQIAFKTVQAKPPASMALVANDDAVGDPASEYRTSYPCAGHGALDKVEWALQV